MADPYMDSSSEFSESEEEGIDDYRKGGYHAIRLGDSFKNGKYVVQKKLGWGQFSTVWLAWDVQQSRYVALKVQKSAQHFTEAALEEVSILKYVADRDPNDEKCVVKLLDHFKHSGPNGQHVCMVFEYLGDSLLSLIKYTRYRGLPLDIVRKLCKQILVGLDYLHRELSIIHTDLKPENILLYSRIDPAKDPRNSNEPPLLAPVLDNPSLLRSGSVRKDGFTGVLSKCQRHRLKRKARRAASRLVSSVAGGSVGDSEAETLLGMQASYTTKIETLRTMDLRCKIVDVGNACWLDKQVSGLIQTRQYRAPEIILGLPYSASVDMWSFACIVFELATGDMLFDTQGQEGSALDEDHLAMMMELLGKMPRKIALSGNNSRVLFDRYGDLRHIRRLRFWSLDRILVEKYKFSEKDADELAKFIFPLLDFAPEKRPTAEQCLAHPWIKCETVNDPAQPLGKNSISKNFAVSRDNSSRQRKETVESIKENLDKQRNQTEGSPREKLKKSEDSNKKTSKKEDQTVVSRKVERAEDDIKKLPLNEDRSGFGNHWQKARFCVNKASLNEGQSRFSRPFEKAEVSMNKLARNEGQPGVSVNKLGINEGQSGFVRPRMFVSEIHLRASRC